MCMSYSNYRQQKIREKMNIAWVKYFYLPQKLNSWTEKQDGLNRMMMLMLKPYSASYSVSPLYSVSHQLHNLLQGWCLWQVNENMTETAWAKNAQKQLTFPCCQKPHWQRNCGWVLHGGELDGGSGSCIICASGGSEAICLDWGELTHRALVLWSTARAKLADHMEMNNLCVLKYSLDSHCMVQWHVNENW